MPELDSFHDRLAELFSAALDVEASRRAEWLRLACGADERLHAELLSLLAHADSVPPVLRTGGIGVVDEAEPTPRTIGSYRVLSQLGEGGMGVVFLAEEDEPVRREVAVKLIRPGVQTPRLLERFRYECRALALMSHPNIAQVFSAGTTAEGRPYVVLEYVAGGKPITDFSDALALGIRSRLEIFAEVCDAVQHAHDKGVLHRDLKPSNLLVARVGERFVPKVIDFGIARALEGDPTQTTLRRWVGTPDYMSPEHARADRSSIDGRSDVYSLGVVLHELLSGSLPMRPSAWASGAEEWTPSRFVLRATAPSTPWRTRGEPTRRTLARHLRGELDWIVSKALAYEVRDRYASPQELAADIRRYLRGDRVLAARPSVVRRVRRTLRRHPLAAAGIATLCAAGLVVALLGIVQRNREDELARIFMDLVSSENSPALNDDSPWARELRAGAIKGLRRTRGADHPETIEAELAPLAIKVVEFRMEEAEPGLVELEARARRALGPEVLATLRVQTMLGRLYTRQKRFELAEPLLRTALATLEKRFGHDHPDTLMAAFCVGSLLSWQDRWQDAARMHLEWMPAFQAHDGDHQGLAVVTEYNLACAAALRGESDCAIYHLRRAIEGGFVFEHRRPDGTIVGGNHEIFQDPPLRSLHGQPAFEALVRDGGYMQNIGRATWSNLGEARSEIQFAIDQGLTYVDWLPDTFPASERLLKDPQIAALLASVKPPPRPACRGEETRAESSAPATVASAGTP